jgi:Ca2+-binding RTX toxin-like protein
LRPSTPAEGRKFPSSSLGVGGGHDFVGLFDQDDGPVSIDLTAGTVQGLGGDTVRSVEDAEGSFLSDTLIGNAANNVLSGDEGDDHMEGRAGDDVLFGDDGVDLLDGGDGTDRCSFGETELNCEL